MSNNIKAELSMLLVRLRCKRCDMTWQVKARAVCSALNGMVTSVSSQKGKMVMGNKKESCGTAGRFLHDLSKQGALCGFCTPLQTIYITEDPPAFLGRCASMVTVSQLPRYVLDTHLGTLTSLLKKVALDFSPVVIGLGTFLRQFHPTYLIQYVQYMGQYIRVNVETCGAKHEPQKGTTDSTSEVGIFSIAFTCFGASIPIYP
ncbi:WASH complex [Macleaya cordata]|uniref:WASH complex n=1 Tax=Macleaya cordata TaxID=56857 RepID=A0A200QH14_MACCD|nr:WASH complex [Macleaya cordata]